MRAGQAWFNRAGAFRLIAINGGLVLWLLPTPSWVKVTGSVLALVAATAFLPLMGCGVRASLRVRRDGDAAASVDPEVEPAPLFAAAQLIAGVTALAAAVVIGVAIDPSAVAANGAQAAAVTGSGRTVRVEVTAAAMRFVPAQVHVRRGDRLIVALVNADTTTHDLVIGQASTGRIAPGTIGEVMLPFRGGTSAFHAHPFDKASVFAVGEEVLVIYYEPPQTVYVEELPDVLRKDTRG